MENVTLMLSFSKDHIIASNVAIGVGISGYDLLKFILIGFLSLGVKISETLWV